MQFVHTKEAAQEAEGEQDPLAALKGNVSLCSYVQWLSSLVIVATNICNTYAPM